MATQSFNVPKDILTEGHYQQIKNALDVFDAIQAHIDMAKRAGVDVTAHEKRLHESKASLLALKNVYFPGR